MYEDREKNILLGLDNGITCINMSSPIHVYNDDVGSIGSVYATVIYNQKLFLGTNQGLFYRDLNKKEGFDFIEDTQGQVWSLLVHDNTLFCGHNAGTYVIENGKAKKISNIEGAWDIKPIKGRPNELIQGNYKGLSILEKTNNTWRLKNKIDGFDISSRYFEFVSDNEVLISHEYKGVIKLKLNPELSKVLTIEINDKIKGLKSSLANYKGQIYYAYKEGVYKYNTLKNEFIKDTLLTAIIKNKGFISGKLIGDEKNNRLLVVC